MFSLKRTTLIFSALLLLCATTNGKQSSSSTPNLTVIFVVDQFAYHYLWKIRPFLKYGLKKILDKGVVYHDATYPHAMPSTPTGHAALGTGTFGYVHGITGYGWIDENNEKKLITEDSTENAAVFSKSGVHDFGRSAKSLMVDTICDQFALTNEPSSQATAYAISLKSRASIMLAGRKGKAIWFDDLEGGLTSSKAYFPHIPKWLKKVNKELSPKHKAKYRWNYFHNKNSKAYNFHQAKNYEHSAFGKNFVGQTFKMDLSKECPFEQFKATPFGHQMLLSAAKKCITNHLNVNEHRHGRMLLFIGLSSFDLSGHYFGPDSLEQIDMLYHLDKQIGKFMNTVQAIAGRKKTLFGLTADHGVMPIPEIMNEKGFSLPERIDVTALINEMNGIALAEFGVKDVVRHYEAPMFFMDKKVLRQLDEKHQDEMLERLRDFVASHEQVRDCWTLKDLEQTNANTKNKYKLLFAKQIYKNRAGELIMMPHPYRMITKYGSGTSHATPYRYDTHVPLAFYQSGTFDSGVQVQQPVSMTQFPMTLARLINCPAPSCARGPILPGLYKF